MNNQQFQNQIAVAKRDLEMTDEQLARHLNVSFSYYMKIVNGETILPVVKRKAFLTSIDGLYKRCGMK
ncbi:hypothetical protein JK627_23970 [Bacillus paranthracis]|uniref:hypothetical protein n=1 Tax=Bacillus paranthracis TaxID=2026186 RepID=UPI003A80FFF5